MRGAPHFHIARIHGISVGIDYSWFIVAGLVLWSTHSGFLSGIFPWLPGDANWLFGILAFLSLATSVIAHEFLRAIVSLNAGISIRTITLHLYGSVGSGDAQPRSEREEFRIGISGLIFYGSMIIVSLILTFVSAKAWGAGFAVSEISRYVMTANIFLLAVNCLPGLPLDAGRLLRAKLWNAKADFPAATEQVVQISRIIAWGMMTCGLIALFAGRVLSSFWLFALGIFLKQCVESGHQIMMVRKSLAGLTVRDIMTEEVVAVPPDLSLKDFAEAVLWKHGFHSYPVLTNGRFIGIVRLHDCARYSREEWPGRTIGEVMTKRTPDMIITPEDDLTRAFYLLTGNSVGRLVVLDKNEKIIGYLSLRDITYLLRMKNEL